MTIVTRLELLRGPGCFCARGTFGKVRSRRFAFAGKIAFSQVKPAS
jgi:hypothetical protein